jgi:DNA-binding CsgD family transcriptional regulator
MTGVRLTSDDVTRLNLAQRALLSPLDDEDPLAWQLRANCAVRQLVGADHSIFSLPGDSLPSLVTDDTDPTFPERFLGYCTGMERGEYRFNDPFVQRVGRARRAAGTGAYHELMLGSREVIRRSTAYQELFLPAGLTNLIGFSLPLPVGEATQFFSFEGPGAERRSERGLEVLRLLVPAFEAGVRIQLQRMAGRSTLASLFDRLGKAAAFYAADGTPLHRTEALSELLLTEPETERLREHVDLLARKLATGWRVPNKTTEPPKPSETWTCVTTAIAEYRLLGSYLASGPFGTEGVLVIIEPLRPLFPSAAELRARFGLTNREVQVALLLAEGLTDGALADRLALSPHTARRYSERVLRKLGLHSRAAVALTLLRDIHTSHPD